MAQFNVYGISELITKMNRMGAVEEIAPEMLEAGMEVLQPEVKAAAEKHRDSGAMADSIKPTGINHTGSTYYVCTRPTGKDEKGVRNMAKAAYLEFGVKGRPAVPFITGAVIKVQGDVITAMRRAFEKKVAQL